MAYLLRLPPDLHALAVSHAEALGLSFNRFIALALTEHFRRCGDVPPALRLATAVQDRTGKGELPSGGASVPGSAVAGKRRRKR